VSSAIKVNSNGATKYMHVHVYSWRGTHLEREIVAQLVKKIATFYGTWKFTAVFTRACHYTKS
jgi:hypothetical protein